jgi:hypothetical protein
MQYPRKAVFWTHEKERDLHQSSVIFSRNDLEQNLTGLLGIHASTFYISWIVQECVDGMG